MRPLVHFVLFTPKIARTHPENARTVSGMRAPARGIFRCLNFCNLAPNALICVLRIIKPRLFADGYTCSRDSAVILWMTLHIQALQGSDLHGTWRIETNQREER